MPLTVGELVAYVDIDDKGFQQGARDIDRGLNRLESTATRSTARMETVVSRGFQTMARSAVDALDDVDQAAGKLVKYGDIDIDVDADTAAALAALRAVEGALDAVDGRDVRANVDVDTRGALAGLDTVVDGAERSGSAIGRAMNAGLGVIGKAGPANVALLAGAIQALPAVAGIAASGIVLAVGGALAAVGVKAAAGSEKVKEAWSELGEELKAELADAAEPLEDSLVRAADVAESTFMRIKPALARIFRDLVPDLDVFIDGVAAGVQRIMPHLEKVGDSFGDLLSNLGREMPAIMDTLGETFSTFAGIMDENPEMLSGLVRDAAELLRVGAEVLSWADEAKIAFGVLTGTNVKPLVDSLMGGSPEEQMRHLEELPDSMAAMELSVRKVIAASYDLGTAGGEAATGVRDLNAALEEHFDPAQKALDAEIRLKEAIQGANQAAKDKKLTEVERLSTVKDMTGAIRDAAAAEMEQTGKVKDSAQAYLESLPRLLDYAGNNDTAKAAVTALGDSLGITAKRTKDGVLAVNELGEVIKILPNGKKVEIDANTAKGKKEIADFLLYVARQKGTIDVHVRTIYDTPSGRKAIEQKTRATGGIFSRDGNTRYMASGGIMGGSSMSPPPPMIADRALFLPHNNTVFGEAGREAFIPLNGRNPSRAAAILAEAADELGFAVMNKQAQRTFMDASAAVGATGDQVSTGLESAMQVVSETLGSSGTLTSAIIGVGEAGGEVADSWTSGSDQISRSVADAGDRVGNITQGVATTVSAVVGDMTGQMGESIGDLSGSVLDLARAVMQARAAADSRGRPGGKQKGGDLGNEGMSRGSTNVPSPGSSRGGMSRGSTNVPSPQQGGLVGGHYGTGGGAPLVDMRGSNWTVREEADIDRVGSKIGFKVMAHGQV